MAVWSVGHNVQSPPVNRASPLLNRDDHIAQFAMSTSVMTGVELVAPQSTTTVATSVMVSNDHISDDHISDVSFITMSAKTKSVMAASLIAQ
jgi:hypothetical protein